MTPRQRCTGRTKRGVCQATATAGASLCARCAKKSDAADTLIAESFAEVQAVDESAIAYHSQRSEEMRGRREKVAPAIVAAIDEDAAAIDEAHGTYRSPLRKTLEAAIDELRACCLDDEGDRERVVATLLDRLRASPDATLVRNALGSAPSLRLSRFHTVNGAVQREILCAAARVVGLE